MNKEQARIAIIGAGWVGIGCARMLLEAGYKIDVFESNPDVGGVWHPQNHYSGLEIHSYAKNVEFFDFPLPGHVNKADRITAQQVFTYLCDYCKFHNLYNFITFNTQAERIDYNTNTNEYEVFFKKYTHVIYTHGFSSRSLPEVEGIKKFFGKAIHSFFANQALIQSLVEENKKVIIVGGSKTATDLILQFQKRGYQVPWLYRKNYWFINRDIMYKALEATSQNKKLRMFFTKLIYKISDKCGALHPEAAFYYMRALKLIHTFGKKHGDFKRFHNGALDGNQIKLLSHYNSKNHIPGQIQSFTENGVVLDNGTKLEADYVIFCTGSGPCSSLIDININGKKFAIEKVKSVYRSRVIPQLPGIIFTSFSPFATGVVNGLCYGNWIIKYIESAFGLEHLENESTIYDKPFFQRHLLFDSSDYIIRIGMQMLAPFFSSGELLGDEFEKWHIQNTFSTNAAKPLTFNKPEAKAKV